MNPTKQLLSLSAAVLIASAAAPAAVLADTSVERGRYAGSTSQPATGGGKPFAGSMAISLGLFSNPARVTRVDLTAQLTCADGTTRDGGLVVQGKFGRKGKARGSFSYTVDTCSVVGAPWTASHR